MPTPEQMENVLELVIAGAGFTVTFTVCEVPGQPEVDVGVTVYETVSVPALLREVTVLLSVEGVCGTMLSPVVFGLSVAIQLKVELEEAVYARPTVPPEQIVADAALVITGLGFTLTFIL